MITLKSPASILLTLLITVLIFQAPFLSPLAGFAEEETYGFAQASTKEVYFCEKKDLNFVLFTVPYTYCVEILARDGDWYRVKYADDNPPYRAVYGYCKTDNLLPLTLPPENVYLNMPVTVTFKPDTPSTSLPVLDELNVTAAFYGNRRLGEENYSYVSYDGSFGYIYGANDDYPLNELTEPADEKSPEKGEVNTTLAVALVLAGLAAAALLILYFTKGRKNAIADK